MGKNKFFIQILLLFFCCQTWASNGWIEFSPDGRVNVALKAEGKLIFYKIYGPNFRRSREVVVDSEKKININIDDFNFDGEKDFSIWYVDDGMGGLHNSQNFYVFKKTTGVRGVFPKLRR
ncbi:hypothetical protein [Paraburkholderia sp. RL17-337-BIB-A]|uniref:hypothetical protein n=1 Tax=Paraburkholderia sp. RL17-337-BIB-A TaxID=3031636 RepID=UPI0038BB0B5C